MGVYGRIERDAESRVVSDADFLWADGAERPVQDWNGMRFEWVEFSVKRRNYSFRLGNIAVDMARGSWKALEQHTGMVASQAQINRTRRFITMAENTANWTIGTFTSYASANSLNGGAGKWDVGSSDPSHTNYLPIRKTLLAAAQQINLQTNGVVEPTDLVLIISPGAARRISSSPEIHDYMKYGPHSKERVEKAGNVNAVWGLPAELYGFEVIVENTPYVSTRPTADAAPGTRQWAKADDSAFLVSRKGGINGSYGAPNFSTFQMYWYKWEMAVFAFDDSKNERVEGHVTDCFAEVLAAPESGHLITGIV